jgi:hypothetical protein
MKQDHQASLPSRAHLLVSSNISYENFQFWSYFCVVPGRMTIETKIDEKLDGADNFRAWRYKITLLLEEHDLDMFIKEEVQEPEGNEAKAKHKKDMVKTKMDYCKLHQRPPYPSCIIIIFSKENDGHLNSFVLRKQHQLKDDSENSVEECEDAKLKIHSLLLLKSESNQGVYRIHW